VALLIVVVWLALTPVAGRANDSQSNWALSGRVVDAASGRPIPGAQVHATLDSQLGRSYYASSDANGAYHFDRVQSGTYFVYVPVAHQTVDPSWYVNGVIGSAVDGRVHVEDPPLLDVGGKYRLFLDPRSLMTLVRAQPFTFATTFHPSATASEPARRVVIDAGQTRSGVDIGLRRVLSRRVTGTVVGPKFRTPGGPGENVWLKSADDVRFELTTASTLTQEGRLVFMSVPPGVYTILTSEAFHAHLGGLSKPVSVGQLTVGEADVAGVTVTVPVR